MENTFLLDAQRNLTAYDASYAILAQQLEIPLITADEPTAKAMEWAIRLEEFKLLPCINL